MPLDRTKPAIVHRTIVTGVGNVIDARKRPYEPAEIPAEFFTEQFCTQDGVVTQTVVASTITDQSQNPATFLTPTAETIKPIGLKINVNTAPVEQIAAIDGVGEATAKKVVEEAKKKAFASIDELNERVKLAFGKKWELFADSIVFSDPETPQ